MGTLMASSGHLNLGHEPLLPHYTDVERGTLPTKNGLVLAVERMEDDNVSNS